MTGVHARAANFVTAARDDEAALIGAVRRGDEAAFRRLFDAHVDAVAAVAGRILGDGADADDVVQDTFLAAFRSLGGFGMRSGVRTWLHRIAVNFALRRRMRRARELPRETVETAGDGAARVEATLDLARAAAALERIDEKKREALLLHELHGMTAQEIADLLCAPLSTVLSRIARGRRELEEKSR